MRSNGIAYGLLAALASPAAAYIRFNCANNLVEERADPIVNPGAVAGHVHKIAGGNGFGFDMDYDQARASQCSSCSIKQDLSNYWTPKLYFQYPNGTFQSVPMVGDNAADLNGGMVVYYQQRPGPKNDKLKAFPKDFRMLAGDTNRRNYTGGNDQNAISFNCLGANKPETHGFPNYNCPGGLRLQVYFPSCWDGVNLDSPDHKSHMHYPLGSHYDNGACPDTHPVHLVSLFFEVLYDTNKFADQWYGDNQPFVLSSGDKTGYGFHGDFVNGWDIDTLQNVIEQCDDNSVFGSTAKKDCPPIDTFTGAEQNACKIPSHVDENVRGYLETLPGCNPVTEGPEPAVASGNCTKTEITTASTYYTDVTTDGWAYVGCASDSASGRTFNDKSTQYMANVGSKMTVEWCTDFCKDYKYAALEYASQCFCGNDLAADRAPKEGILGNCNMPCKGDSGEFCGGSWALSTYKKCSGSECQNAQYGAKSNATTSKTKRHIHEHKRGLLARGVIHS